MNNIFQRSRSIWVSYDSYEIKTDDDGIRYLTPSKNAKPHPYNPLKCGEELVLDALNVGRIMMGGKKHWEPEVESAILEFASKYGLLGFMTGLPTTPNFMEYDYVYLPKNQYLRYERMETDDFVNRFFPFDKLDFTKKGAESSWSVEGDNDMLALMLTFSNEPTAVSMSVQRQYSEPYEWYAMQLKNYAFTFFTAFFYYNDKDTMSEEAGEMLRRSMRAFGGVAPTYHIELHNKPVMYWEFHSLMIAIEMMFSFMLVDEENSLHLCKHCEKIFVSSRSNAAFCSPTCKNRYNVYKSRGKET